MERWSVTGSFFGVPRTMDQLRNTDTCSTAQHDLRGRFNENSYPCTRTCIPRHRSSSRFIDCQIRIDENETLLQDSIFSEQPVETSTIQKKEEEIARRRLPVSHRTDSGIRWNSNHGRVLECKQFDVTIYVYILTCKNRITLCFSPFHFYFTVAYLAFSDDSCHANR